MAVSSNKSFAALVIFYSVLSAQPAAASTITNGDFETGLTGYTTVLSGTTVTSTEFATTGTSGANDFLSLEAQGLSGESSVFLTQQVTIGARSLLTFDAAVLSEAATGVNNPSAVPDLLQVSIGVSGSGFTTIFQIDSAANTTNFETDLSSRLDVIAGDRSIFGSAISAFSVTADLSEFSGQTLDLGFGALNFDAVETTTFFGVDNIAFQSSAPPATPIPLPASAWLLLAGCCLLLPFRRGAAGSPARSMARAFRPERLP